MAEQLTQKDMVLKALREGLQSPTAISQWILEKFGAKVAPNSVSAHKAALRNDKVFPPLHREKPMHTTTARPSEAAQHTEKPQANPTPEPAHPQQQQPTEPNIIDVYRRINLDVMILVRMISRWGAGNFDLLVAEAKGQCGVPDEIPRNAVPVQQPTAESSK